MSQPSRRRVVQGAAWTAPAIVWASAAPAFAASCVGCVTLDWNQRPLGTAATGSLTTTGTSPAGCQGLPVTASLIPAPDPGPHHGTSHYRGTYLGSAYDMDGLSETNRGLVLSTWEGSTGVTFTFVSPAKSLSFSIHDFTRHDLSHFEDLTFSRAVTVTRRQGSTAISGSGAGPYSRTGNQSPADSTIDVTTGTVTPGFSSFTVTLAVDTPSDLIRPRSPSIAIGDLSICF